MEAARAAADAAAAALVAGDSYGKALVDWFVAIDGLGDGEWPPKPPKLDTRGRSEALSTSRKAARVAALEYRRLLHDEWEAGGAERKAERKAEYDSHRDWAQERATQAAREEDRVWQAELAESSREWREKQAAVERVRQERQRADERVAQQYQRVRAPQHVRSAVARRREQQWVSRRRPPESSSDSEADDIIVWNCWDDRSRRQKRQDRHAARRREERLSQPPPPPPTAEDVASQVVEHLIGQLEREQRKAEIITDGQTLYDSDFFCISPTMRREDDERGWFGAFVAYPDGSRCWVHPPYARGKAPGGLANVKTPFLLSRPWTVEHGFLPPASVDGATQEEVAQVCVLLQSLSKLLIYVGYRNGSPASDWISEKLHVTRCATHDWCEIRQVPCSTDSLERVLVAVLDVYDVWSISWLAEKWRQSLHVHGISGFRKGDMQITAPIRATPPRPTRSLEQMVVNVDGRYSFGAGWQPIPNEHCRLKTRMLRPGVSVSCAEMWLPPPAVRLRLRYPRHDANGALHVRVSVRATNYYKTAINGICELVDWQKRHVCICDAAVEEMELVLKANAEAARVKGAAWDVRCVQMRKQADAAQKAAATRRENRRKRKLDAVEQSVDCADAGDESDEMHDTQPEDDRD